MKKPNEIFFMRAWAIKEDMLKIMSEVMERHLKGEKLTKEEIEAKTRAKKKPEADYEVVNGTAFIPIQGVISKRMSLFSEVSQNGTSTVEIARNVKAAMKDPAVKRVVFDIDSPGGSVDGVQELSDLIFGFRGEKPMTAYADGLMASAAYWIGSAADEIYATKSTEVGSIGVYSVVRDFSVAEHNAGIKTEIIKAGKHKAAGHPSKALTEDERQVIQEEVNAHYELFTESVARNRGMEMEDVLSVATGRVFIGKKAQELGLIDGIDLIESESQEINAKTKSEITTTEKEADEMDIKTLTLDEVKRDRPDLIERLSEEFGARLESAKKEATEIARKKGADEGVVSERSRILSILKKSSEIKEVDEAAMEAIEKGLPALEAENKMKDKKLAVLHAGSQKPLGPGENEGKEPDHLKRARMFKEEKGCTMTEALKRTATPRK